MLSCTAEGLGFRNANATPPPTAQAAWMRNPKSTKLQARMHMYINRFIVENLKKRTAKSMHTSTTSTAVKLKVHLQEPWTHGAPPQQRDEVRRVGVQWTAPFPVVPARISQEGVATVRSKNEQSVGGSGNTLDAQN